MIYWYDANGRIIQMAMNDDARSGFDTEPGVGRLQSAQQVDVNTHFVQGGVVRPMPERPSEHHQFDYSTKQWALDTSAAWAAVRRQRDGRLARSDWVILRAADQGTTVPPEWLAYRQALRDVTEQDDPLTITWPTPPT